MTSSSADAIGSLTPAVGHNLIHRVNVGDIVSRSAARTPRAAALIDGERRLGYGELEASVSQLANALRARGYGRGDALALVSGNSLEFLQTYYACARLGVVCVPINLGWRPAEVSYVLGHSRARGVVVESQLVSWLEPALARADGVRDVFVAPGVGGEPQAEGITLDELIAGADSVSPACLVEDRDPITYLYTSGTTAAPKGVVGSHLAVYLESTSAAIDLQLRPDDRVAALMPLFHTAQLNCFATPVALAGAALHLMRGFDAAGLLEAVETERLTVIFALPMMYRQLLSHPDLERRDLSSLRLAVYAMAPMPDGDLRRAIDAFGCDFALLFGQTEMSPTTAVFLPEHQLSHAGAVGTPTRNVQVAIMDDDGSLLPQGESGEPSSTGGFTPATTATSTAMGSCGTRTVRRT